MGPVSLDIFSRSLCSAATLHLGVRVSESLYALPATPLDQIMDPAMSQVYQLLIHSNLNTYNHFF